MSTVVNKMTVALILPAKDDLVSRMAGLMTGYAMIPGRGTAFKGKKVRSSSTQSTTRSYLWFTSNTRNTTLLLRIQFFQFVQVEWRRSR